MADGRSPRVSARKTVPHRRHHHYLKRYLKGARSRVSFGTRFVLYQRNLENLCKDRATACQEIQKSVAELYDAALESRATIAIKGAPEQHAEGADIPGDEDGWR